MLFHVCALLLYFHGASPASRLLLVTTEVNQVLEQSSRLDLDPSEIVHLLALT